MNETFTLPENPYVSIEDETIGIRSGSKKYKFPLEKIRKMYVSKRKSGQFEGLLGSLLDILPENRYNLCIQTRDGKETKIKINALERYYFIRLISFIRNINSNSRSTVAA
ncbi:MAG: hypothetical protein ITG00_11335 [Flavobacterium sp.]|nr:hypothetical protein [Flavobacterium sp.]